MTWLFFLFSFNEEGIEGLPCPCGMNVILLSVDATAFPRHVRIRDLVAGRGVGRLARSAHLLFTHKGPNVFFTRAAGRH